MNKWLKKAAIDHYEEIASKGGKASGCGSEKCHYKNRVEKYLNWKRALYETIIYPKYLPYIRGNDDTKYNDLMT